MSIGPYPPCKGKPRNQKCTSCLRLWNHEECAAALYYAPNQRKIDAYWRHLEQLELIQLEAEAERIEAYGVHFLRVNWS